jgi:hypothetical protein
MVEPGQLDAAIESGKKTGVPFLRILVTAGVLSQKELQALVRVQSLIWKGQIDVERAIVALGLVRSQGLDIEQSLDHVGFARPAGAAAEPSSGSSEPAAKQANANVSGRVGAPAQSGPASYCQYCAAPVAAGATRCQFCTGEIAATPSSSGLRAAEPPVEPKASASDGAIAASNPPRDPVTMLFLSGCCLPGLGQYLLGQSGKGIVILVAAGLCAWVSSGAALLLALPVAALDCYLLADKLKNGKVIGAWEFF